jgi:hypothetical protein
MSEIDPSKLNIFEPTHSGRYNACVGHNSQHDMRTYAEGYLQSAQILIDQIFEKDMGYERDTLVHPILYSARHSIELSIKHVLNKLNETDIKTEERDIHGHSLKELWCRFKEQTTFDRRIIEVLETIEPIVTQLDQADPDAQDFRYPENTNGKQTLDGKAIVDLVTVKELVEYLTEKLLYLYDLVEVIVRERQFGAFTKEFNREELEKLSIELPDINTWDNSEEFEVVKNRWKEKYSLSNKGFIRAVDFLKGHREFSGNINNEHNFIALESQLLEELIKKANRIRLEQIADKGKSLREQMANSNSAYASYPQFESRLTPNVMSELNAIFYLSRNREISEVFDYLYRDHSKEFEGLTDEELEGALKKSFLHIYEKTNFIDEIIGGLNNTGRLKLADKLSEYKVGEGIYQDDLGLMMELK